MGANSISIVPDDDTPNDAPPLRCAHEGCTNELERTGRGRPPKYCPEHRGTRSGASSTKGKAPSWPGAAGVEAALNKYLATLAFGITLVNPEDGIVIAEGGPAIAHELVEIGKVDKKFRAKLELLCKPGKYGGLLVATAPVVIGIAANHNLLPQFVVPTRSGKGE